MKNLIYSYVFDESDNPDHNPNQSYSVLITNRSGSRKTNSLINLLRQKDIDKIYIYV